MGQHYEFECLTCSYKVTMSGGNDVGMACATSTILCEKCKELYDVETTDEPWLAMKPDWEPKNLRCPKSKRHQVRLWKHPGECPKCGSTLIRGKLVMLWD